MPGRAPRGALPSVRPGPGEAARITAEPNHHRPELNLLLFVISLIFNKNTKSITTGADGLASRPCGGIARSVKNGWRGALQTATVCAGANRERRATNEAGTDAENAGTEN